MPRILAKFLETNQELVDKLLHVVYTYAAKMPFIHTITVGRLGLAHVNLKKVADRRSRAVEEHNHSYEFAACAIISVCL